MSCGFSREMLALHVEGDLPERAAAAAAGHLASCEDCRRFFEQLQASQALLKSVRRETASASDRAAMRREVMTTINERRGALGLAMRIERVLTLGLRPSYQMAALLLVGVLTMSLVAQVRPNTHARASRSVLEDSGVLRRPEGYQRWILASGSGGAARGIGADDRVYINPSSYQAYLQTGQYPDGTMLVWEPASPELAAARNGPHASSSTLLVTVKDAARFEGGWAFFDFSGTGEAAPRTARALPDSSGCRTCHRQNAQNDHVFTRFPA